MHRSIDIRGLGPSYLLESSLAHTYTVQSSSGLISTGVSVLARGFRLDYILSRYDSMIHTFWKQTLTLAKEHKVEAAKITLKSLLHTQQELDKITIWMLTKDHVAYPASRLLYLNMAGNAYSKQELIKKLEGDFAEVTIETDDLGPSAVALRTVFFNKILKLSIDLKEEQGDKTCMSRDLVLFAGLLVFEQSRTQEFPDFDDDNIETRRAENKLEATNYRRWVASICNTTEEVDVVSSPSYRVRATTALRAYLRSGSMEAGSWPVAQSLEISPEAAHYFKPEGFGKVMAWISHHEGKPGFFLRAFIIYLAETFWPMVKSWPLSFLAHWIFPQTMSPGMTAQWLFTEFLVGLVLRTAVDVLLANTFPVYQLEWVGTIAFQAFLYAGYIRRKSR